jgi:5'-3' exoribonuclease 1
MNGIIHNCTHGNDPGTKLTENEMIAKVFLYLERLFAIIQPQRLLFMAIDGEPALSLLPVTLLTICEQTLLL